MCSTVVYCTCESFYQHRQSIYIPGNSAFKPFGVCVSLISLPANIASKLAMHLDSCLQFHLVNRIHIKVAVWPGAN